MKQNIIISSFPITGLMTMMFIAFKVMGAVTWSWWWVLCPLWIPTALFLAIMFIILIIAFVLALCEKGKK